MNWLARKLVESALAIFASLFICLIVFVTLLWGAQTWRLANCIHAGPGTFACHAAALYDAWWWLAMCATIPVVAVLVFAGRGSHRL